MDSAQLSDRKYTELEEYLKINGLIYLYLEILKQILLNLQNNVNVDD